MTEKKMLLITGIHGLIGSLLTPHLQQSYTVCGLDRREGGSGLPLIRADLSHPKQVDLVFKTFHPVQDVLHLAADPRVDAPWEGVLRDNIQGTWHLYEAAAKAGVRRVVFASSNHVTGCYEGMPPRLHRQKDPQKIKASDPPRPDGPYGISKLAGEGIARCFFDLHQIESVCLRIGSVLEDDDPTGEERHRSTWLSHRDLKQLVERAFTVEETFPGFGVYYRVSENTRRFWSLENARRDLGYQPLDNAEDHWVT